MKRPVRLAVITAAVVCVLAAALAWFVNANDFRPMLTSELTQVLGRNVEIGDLHLAILSGGITADRLSVADDPAFSRNPFLTAKSLAVNVELMPLLFSHKANVTGITLDQPDIVLLQSPSGQWNFSTLGAKTGRKTPPNPTPSESGQKFSFSVKHVRITGGRLTIGSTRAKARPQVYTDVTADVRDFSAASAFPFSLAVKTAGGGSANLDGKAGPIPANDTSLTPFQATATVKHLDLVAAGLVNRASGFSALLSLNGSGSSDGRALHAEGRVTAEQLKVARDGSAARRPVQFDFAADQDLARHAGTLRRGDIHIGAAAARLTGTWIARGDSTFLAMQVDGRNMPIPDLEAMLPALGVVLPAGSSLQGGTAQASVAMRGPTDGLVSSGDVTLNHTRLAGFDLGSRVRTIANIAGIRTGPNTDIETFTASVRMAPEGTTVHSLTLLAPAIGELSGAGTVSPGHALDFKMLMNLHTAGLMNLVSGQRGELGVPFFIRGTSSAPSFVPDVRGIATSEAKSLLKSQQVQQGVNSLLQGILGGKKK